MSISTEFLSMISIFVCMQRTPGLANFVTQLTNITRMFYMVVLNVLHNVGLQCFGELAHVATPDAPLLGHLTPDEWIQHLHQF